MGENTINFDQPPVVETAVSVQFTPLPAFNAAHAGCFWQTELASLDGWKKSKLVQVERLEDVFEDASADLVFRSPSIQLRQVDSASRIQIVRDDEERMVQIQDSRFIYNWRKREGDYPTYAKLKPEFDDLFDRFSRYLTTADFPSPNPNQWEVVYVNQITRGSLWASVRDWVNAIPSLYVPTGYPKGDAELQTMAGMWRYRLMDGRGRLHVSLQHGQTPGQVQVILLQMIARGPIDVDSGLTLEEGLSLGHKSIVETFYHMTSTPAHLEWKEGPK